MIVNIFTPQEFLHSAIFGTPSTDSEEAPPTIQPAPPISKPTLYPAPSPIASPRPGWPGSPSTYGLPSIPPPSVPSPRYGASGIRMGHGGWDFEVSLEEFRQLLAPPTTLPTSWDGYLDDCSPLEVFLGSLSLMFHFASFASKFQTGQQAQILVSTLYLNVHKVHLPQPIPTKQKPSQCVVGHTCTSMQRGEPPRSQP